MISLIAAISQNNCIGRDNDLPWHIPEDLKFFMNMTKGKVVIMGRKTWESIPEKYRPLPHRTNVVITRQTDYVVPEEISVFQSIEDALKKYEREDIMIAGGGQIYALTIDRADTLYITHVEKEIEDCHAFFPEIDMGVWEEVERNDREGYSFVTYEKITKLHET